MTVTEYPHLPMLTQQLAFAQQQMANVGIRIHPDNYNASFDCCVTALIDVWSQEALKPDMDDTSPRHHGLGIICQFYSRCPHTTCLNHRAALGPLSHS